MEARDQQVMVSRIATEARVKEGQKRRKGNGRERKRGRDSDKEEEKGRVGEREGVRENGGGSEYSVI